MKIALVKNANGRAVIYWPGVLSATAVVTLIASLGTIFFVWATGWYSIKAFMLLPFISVGVVGSGIVQGLSTDPAELPSRSRVA